MLDGSAAGGEEGKPLLANDDGAANSSNVAAESKSAAPATGEGRRRWTRGMKVTLMVLVFNTIVTVSQFICAGAAKSLALVGDAIHMSIDSVTYGMNFYVERERLKTGPTSQLLFLELVVSTVSLVALIGSTAWVCSEAAHVLTSKHSHEEVNGDIMLFFACFGLLVDCVSVGAFFVSCEPVDSEGKPLPPGGSERDCYDDDTQKLGCGGVGGACAGGCRPRVKPIVLSNVNLLSLFVHVACDLLRSLAIIVAAIMVEVSQVQARRRGTKALDSHRTDAIAALVVSGLVVAGAVALVVQIIKGIRVYRSGDAKALDAYSRQGGAHGHSHGGGEEGNHGHSH